MTTTQTAEHWAWAVYAIVRDPRGRVLMVRRAQTVKHYAGCWELPGGKPAPGESYDETTLIKVFEETGLDVKLTGIAGAVEGSLPGLRIALLIMEARTRATEITLGQDQDAYLWLRPAEIFSLKLRPPFRKFLAAYLKPRSQRPAKKTRR